MKKRAPTLGAVILIVFIGVAGYFVRQHDQSKAADQKDLCHLAKSNSEAIRVIAESQLTVFNTVLAGSVREDRLRQQLTTVVQDLALQIDTLKTRERQPCP